MKAILIRFLQLAFLPVLLFIGINGWGQISEGFESGMPTSYTTGTVTLNSGDWSFTNVQKGTTGVHSGSCSAKISSQTSSAIITPTITGGVGEISFYVTASTSSGAYQVNISDDNGGTWTSATGSPFTISTTTTLNTITVNDGTINKVQIRRTGALIYIDDFATTVYVPAPEPTNHASSFAVTTSSTTHSSITLTWSDNDGTQAADGFLIKASDVGYGSIADPVDGTAESDGTLVKNVAHGTQTVDFTGLTASTTYYFKIWPYTNSGNNIDYKTNGTIPQVSETTSAVVIADLVITEIADPADNANAKFVEIYNATSSSIDLTGYSIRVYSNGQTTHNDVTLSGTIASEGIIVAGYTQSYFYSAYGFNPDFSNLHISGNGDDVYELFDGTNVVDVYGVVGVDGTGEDWEYTDSKAYRLTDETSKSKGNQTFSASEWDISSANVADFTPGALESPQSQSTLPIEIISFNGIRKNNQNILKWQTATEINNNFFTIERSDNGKNFYGIGTVEAAGNSNAVLDYSFVDESKYSNTVYYRLKQTDYDGKFTYSNIISVSEANQDFAVNKIYASTENKLVIDLYSNASNKTEIQVLNTMGQVVANKSLEVSKGNGIYSITLPNLSQGIYFIKIYSNKYSSCSKVKL